MNRKTFSRSQTGLSIIESLITLAATSVALGAAVPGFTEASQRRQLEGAAAQLNTDIQLARSEAVASNHTLRLSFSNSAAGSCYVIHTGSAGDCRCSPTGAPVCTKGARTMRSNGFEMRPAVQMTSNVPSIVFDPFKGTSSPTGTMRLSTSDGHELRLVVNIMGRVRTCTASADIRGYKRC